MSSADVKTIRVWESWRGALFSGIGTLLAILIAFALDAGWSYNADRARETAYRDALRSELTATRAGLVSHRERIQQTNTTIRHYLATVAAGDPAYASADTINAMVEALGPFSEFVPRRAALDDLLGSGGLQLIQSDSLRRTLASYKEALDRDAADQRSMIDLWRTQLSPYDVAHAHLSRMLFQSGEVRLPFKPDADAFYGNRAYANLLFSRINFEEIVLRRHVEVLGTIDALLGLLEP